jgi:gamma-glutamyltranspeptidase/glutathione hydrolase
VLGTPGGTTIFTNIFQTIIDVFDFGMSAAEAASAPRFHHQPRPNRPSDIFQSPSHPLDANVQAELMQRGYEFVEFEIGDMQIIVRQDETIQVGSDERMRGVSRLID